MCAGGRGAQALETSSPPLKRGQDTTRRRRVSASIRSASDSLPRALGILISRNRQARAQVWSPLRSTALAVGNLATYRVALLFQASPFRFKTEQCLASAITTRNGSPSLHEPYRPPGRLSFVRLPRPQTLFNPQSGSMPR